MRTIRKSSLIVTAIVLFASLSFAQCSSSSKSDKKSAQNAAAVVEHQDAPNLVEIAASDDNFSTLVAAVKAAGLVEALQGGPLTIFAPVNSAFDKLPEGTVASLLEPENKDMLTSILTYHVISGKLMASDVVAAIKGGSGSAEVETLNGGKLTAKVVDGNVVLVDESGNMSTIIQTDVAGSNGVIHVIDSVVLPK